MVYWTHENTIAPIAKSAPNCITFVAILITYVLVAVTPPPDGRYPSVPSPHFLRNVAASVFISSTIPLQSSALEYAK